MADEQNMEAPECPVCLQPYDDNTIPRVLGCGHSACQSCLANLHKLNLSSSPSPYTIRCPCCTQLVKFPHPQGPTALPKNIDLLQLSFLLQNPNSAKPKSPLIKANSPPRRRFKLWFDELFSYWKKWILPYDVVLKEDGLKLDNCKIALCSDLGLTDVIRCRLVENQEVGFVKLVGFDFNESLMDYSYVGKIMVCLSRMNDSQRDEISSLLLLSLKNSRVCSVLGLWLDEVNSGFLYLITQRMTIKNESLNFGNGIEKDNKGDGGFYLGLLGVELCEALISLNVQGFLCGCLGLSCLCFDEFGHIRLDLGEALVVGANFFNCVVEGVVGGRNMDEFEVGLLIGKVTEMNVFVSPEVVFELLIRDGVAIENNEVSYSVCYGSDVWLLACILIRVLIGDQFSLEMYNYLRLLFNGVSGCENIYLKWVATINAMLEPLLVGNYASLHEILLKCLNFDPKSRPLIIEVWKCIEGLNKHPFMNHIPSLNNESVKENFDHCLALGELCSMVSDLRNRSRTSKSQNDDGKHDLSLDGENRVDNVVEGLSAGKVRCKNLQGHLDCITGLCVGGGYLFSSSFDKTVIVWSLQDFTHVHTFTGHEHRVMALVFVNQEKPLCISADSGGGIFAWQIDEPLAQQPLTKWYEEKDWRYSGIHALAVSESGYLFTGSGDRLIKAWLLKDHTLVCSMEGHKSVVSTLALCNGVLYSGSWDGTVRLWCLNDHTPLAVFGEDMPGTMSSVLFLFADLNMIIGAHENGCIKIWVNDVLKKSFKSHNGAVFSVAKEGNVLLTGGWDRTVKFQEATGGESEMNIVEVGSIACDSVITALLCVQGTLFVGCANKLIKAYHCGE
ncbi:uncharacterized protein LOC130827662 isoform X1 [Amaranthus tricolor]|uniref:uncharacterized protein LOC130827662 isoform X1 n=1 Tax=Amaranthus tricolor TaxID=29722 RepID=UPI00258AB7BB|nr:uncharacterized protein LOC130827662 isoform X1 [Amaranthus tricolor]